MRDFVFIYILKMECISAEIYIFSECKDIESTQRFVAFIKYHEQYHISNILLFLYLPYILCIFALKNVFINA